MRSPIKTRQRKVILLDGQTLTTKNLAEIVAGAKVKISARANKAVKAGNKRLQNLLRQDRPMYSINTGFGAMARHRIRPEDLAKLQRNIILSHAGGWGPNLSREEVRAAMTLRLNVLLKGLTGVRPILCKRLADMLNLGLHPMVPSRGSVGASGDLIPLAHLALPIIGAGSVEFKGREFSGAKAIKLAKLKPIVLGPKEGLSLINGTQIMQAVGGLALWRAMRLFDLGNRICALSYEALQAHVAPLDARLHKGRGQAGQIIVAKAMRDCLKGSSLYQRNPSNQRNQDPYSLRCAPQVHGAAWDALSFADKILTRELNAATDNPLIFPTSPELVCGGNFHGQPLAIAFDSATMAMTQLSSISERRLELLINPQFSGLPGCLTPEPGLQSGYMVLQYLAAALVNENKLLSHPASTDSIPGNAGIEDFVSMGMTAALKFRSVVENCWTVFALELLAAAQAIDLRPEIKLGHRNAAMHRGIRQAVPTLRMDRVVSEDIRASRAYLTKYQPAAYPS